jgi:2-C-methyl-D-erythritol 4-phosphate cytidylyltransferase
MAGSRETGDPLALASGVPFKALAPIDGIAMLARVLHTLRSTTSVTRIVVCGLSAEDAGDLADTRSADGPTIEFATGDRTPGASAARAIATLGLEPPILITTADHPLLTPKTLQAFCERAITADVTFGLVPAGIVQAAFPGIRRTAYKFRDGGFCGCNLYALLTPSGCEAPTLWASLETHRKRPWRLIGMLGYGTMVRFFLGRLALADLTGLVFASTGLRIRPVLLSDPAAGFDVDTAEQRDVAEAFFLDRAAAERTTASAPSTR